MIGLRPRTHALFLERPRLLERLPQDSGYTVWLEAPYGYGKSVLTAQWAARLEAEGWRVVWLGLTEGDPREALAALLGLGSAPWGVVLEELARTPTAVILEDLERPQGLSPLLKHNPGLVLLSSRQPLPEPELPRLMAEGRLLHLKAEQLAFTAEEAERLFSDPQRSREAWEKTGGWSLPLHLAVLTGELPGQRGIEQGGLWEGMRESLSEPEWEEALFLAALPLLPASGARPPTLRLAGAGFVQTLEGGYRLHPMIGESLLRFYPSQVQSVVGREAGRLDPALRGEALERAGLHERLGALLEAHPELSLDSPQAVLRWDRLAGGERRQGRLAAVGDALCTLGHVAQGLPLLLEAARFPGAPVEARLAAYREAVWWLAEHDRLQAQGVVEEAQPLLEGADPVLAARFLNNASRIYFEDKDYPTGEATLSGALALLPPDHPRRAPMLVNLGILRWNHFGDLESRLQTTREALRQGSDSIVPQKAILLLDLGRHELLLGQREAALAHWRKAEEEAGPQPWAGLEAQVLQAIYSHRFGEVAALLARLKQWEKPLPYRRDLAFWALELINLARGEAALQVLRQDPEPAFILWRAAYALALARSGAPGALEALEPRPSDLDRELALHWHAARYRITRSEADLRDLLGLTLVGEAILPGLIPLSELPRQRPELSRPYPVAEVLGSGWKEAITLRLDEVPPLELGVLGRLEVRLLGQETSLSARPREIFLLMLLGLRREAIAEALWPEAEREKSRNNLYVNLNGLRKILEPWGVTTYLGEEGLQRTHSDLWALEAALRADDIPAVMNLYRGRLAPGIDLEPVNEVREHLHEQVIGAVFAAATPPGGKPGLDREACLEWILHLEPLHEDALRELLSLLVASGRANTARRRYERFAQHLRRETGLEPTPQTRQLVGPI